ncbi:MAG: hypothetical protein U0270_21980 [Labilithrix sp.]
MPELARLLDPAEVDAIDGPHGKMSIELSEAQLGATVEIVVPARLACARCDGGGCDSCGRSGAIRLELDEDDRKTQFGLPAAAPSGVRVRLLRPVAGLELLTVEVRLTPSTALVHVPPSPLAVVSKKDDLRSIVIAIGVILAAALAIAAGLR